MYETFNSHPKNIGDLLSGNERARIVVPQFQRGYSWEKKHVEAFWNDISSFQRESKVKDGPVKYFLGPIVILSQSKDVIAILDGQQRLATATILFCVMRDLARTIQIQAAQDFARDVQRELIEKEGVGFSLELGEMDKLYFIETVQNDPPSCKPPTLRSHRNIQKAQQFFKEALTKHIAAVGQPEAVVSLKELRQILRSDLVMACIPVNSERDAFLIFETLNDRGLRLSVPDLLLNYLMRVGDEADRKSIREFWNEMLDRMGKRDINRFLRHMWVSKFGDLKTLDLFSALKAHIEKNNIKSLDFTRTCSEECESYVHLLEQKKEHLKGAAPLVRNLIQQLDFQPALPPLLSAYLCLPDDLEKIARWLLVYVARYSIFGNLDSSGLETVLFQLARDIRTLMTKDENKKACLKHIKDTLVQNSPSDDQVKSAMTDLILSPEQARYVLVQLARKIQSKTKEVTIDEANIEHVFPKSPSSDWKNVSGLQPYLWHIGNLTVLGTRLNKNAANSGYPTKRPYYQANTELEMTKQLANKYDVWNVNSIKARAEELGADVIQIWNFDNTSRV
jgi:hypothetical protein